MFLMTSGFVEGYDVAVTAFANLYVQDRYFLSLGSLGAAIGALISGPIVDKWGRRPIVIFADILYLVGGAALSLYSFDWWLVYVGRVCIGLAIGVTSMNVPIYISEVVPNEVRGRFVAWYTFAVVLGQLVANVVAILLADHFLISFWIGEFFVILQLFGMFVVLPESPRWLAKNGQMAEAHKVLDQIYKPEYVQIYKRSLDKEIAQIRITN